MKIVQAAVLILVGAAGAILYVKVKGEAQDSPVAVKRELVQPAVDPAPEPVPEHATAPEATPPPAPDEAPPAPVRHERKPARHAPVVVARNMEPPPVDIQPVPQQTPQEPPPAPIPPVQPAPAPVVEPAPQPQEAAPPLPPAPRQATIKAGTLVPVRLQDALSSDRNHPGDTFIATLDAPLVVDGLVLAEKGARVDGRVVETQQAGRVKGLASLALELTRLSLSDGQRVTVSTDSFTKMGPESHGTDAAKIGGGAALGAIIGAIAGGGKGAAIGAGVGGAAGTGTVLGTRGKPAVLPSETKISFRLNNTITVTEQRGRS
jgi:hypothetical protein